ncbi:hypothetical protein HTG_17625 [Natrinema mahii]|nr:hypothetical protein HTG_17625 [Natrinema mahii]
MTEVPDVPEEFETGEELVQYIEQLQDQIGFLEEELEDAEKDPLALRHELNEIEEKASQQARSPESFVSLMEPLEEIRQRLVDVEEKYLDDDSGYGLSDDAEATQELSDALGYDITQDVDQ